MSRTAGRVIIGGFIIVNHETQDFYYDDEGGLKLFFHYEQALAWCLEEHPNLKPTPINLEIRGEACDNPRIRERSDPRGDWTGRD